MSQEPVFEGEDTQMHVFVCYKIGLTQTDNVQDKARGMRDVHA